MVVQDIFRKDSGSGLGFQTPSLKCHTSHALFAPEVLHDGECLEQY